MTEWSNILNNVSTEYQDGDFPDMVKYVILEIKRVVWPREMN